MTAIALRAATGVLLVDQLLRDLVARVELAFPGRVRGYYLVGSYAVGEAQPSSDVDLVVLFADEPDPATRERFAQVRGECQRLGAPPLDLSLQAEPKLMRVGGVWFQTASLLVYGDDVRPYVPRKPAESHARDLMHAVLPLLARVRGGPSQLHMPLAFPDPAGPLYGYDARARAGAGPYSTPTKDLVTNVLAAANALTLLQTREYVGSGRKSDIPIQYRLRVGGVWAALVEDVFEYCRVRWDYQVPVDPADRARLRGLCQQTLAFENSFMACYRAFLLEEAQRPPQA